MRPHRLRLSAFGAFGQTVEVDLDRLADAGLFLLHGPTGAGKTTLLDGIGFALFGRVPGARQVAKRLRSDHADPATPTGVELEVSFGTRRFRISRSPDYERPKRRGTGTTTEKATVRLEELVAGAWELRSDRFDEAGQEVQDLVGMSAEQFFQVVLLPQGDFARFLRAGAEEKTSLLQRLFATERFRDAEQWLAAQRRTTAEAVAAQQDQVDLLAARVAEAAWAEDVSVPQDLLTCAARSEQVCAEAVTAATGERDRARAALDAALSLADRQRRRAEALRREQELTGGRTDRLVLQQELDAAARAAEVAGALDELAARRRRRDAALSGEATARAALPLAGLEAAATPADLDAAALAARERLGSLEALRAVQGSHDQERAAALAAAAEQAQALTAVSALEVHLAALPERRLDLDARAAAGREAQARRPELLSERDRLHALLPDVAALPQVEALVGTLEGEHLAARERHVALAEKANELRTASINTMVARLAFALEHGAPCPVCGALEHPDPSALRDEGVSAEDEDAARRRADDALAEVAELEVRLAAARARRDDLTARCGAWQLEALDARLAEVSLELAVLDARTRDADRALLDAEALGDELRAATAELVAQSARAEACGRRAADATTRADAAAAALRDALDGALDVDTALARTRSRAEAATAACQAAEQLQHAQRDLDAALATAEAASRARGFGDLEAARAALREEAWRERTAASLRSAADQEAAVQAALADPALDVPLDPPAPVDDAEQQLRVRDSELTAATAEHARAAARRTALSRLVPELVSAHAALQPLQERATEVRRIADLAAGLGQNQLRMTLSAFVLAARLEEVAAAASARLRRMTQGRYELVHTDGGGRANAKAGLGLLARDAWSGRDRDTATLSGGETFLASLALALGLADVVMAEAGGARIEALFVDEGFGTLDEQTLDEVMDVLDGLREGGRVVGLVSHVSELRQRVPAQVEVRTSRAGSEVVLHGC